MMDPCMLLMSAATLIVLVGAVLATRESDEDC